MRYCEVCGAAFRHSRTCPRDGVALAAGAFDPFIGRVLGDRYRILERVGAGSMGQVYRAAHTRIACTFAVKVVWGDIAYDSAMQARFAREAETASCLQSRWIVRVVDFASAESSAPYLVMEFLDGPTLHDVLVRENTVPAWRAIRIAQRIALGLAHAHDRGVVHRDMKPENVLLAREDDEPDVVKILDFGVARLADAERLTSGGMALGTPLYMAPEVVTGGTVDGRADLYALGAMLVEMLTGKPPFDAPSLEGLLRAQLTTPPPSMREVLASSGGPAGLDDVVQRLLAKRPEDRFASAREVVQALADVGESSSRRTPAPSLRLPAPPPVLAALERVIIAGAPVYNAGDHAGCYALYRGEAERLIAEHPVPAAMSARLAAGLSRAATRPNATDAAWDLRHAFDDLLLPGPYAAESQDLIGLELAALASIGWRREAQGQLDILGDYHVAFARGLAHRVRIELGRLGVAAELDAAAAHAEALGGGGAVAALAPALAALGGAASGYAGGRASVPPVPSTPSSRSAVISAPVGATAHTRLAAGPLRTDLRHSILRAIERGAPVYNDGRHQDCAQIYRQAAEAIVGLARTDVGAQPVEEHLRRALVAASTAMPSDAAWILRKAFDAVLALD